MQRRKGTSTLRSNAMEDGRRNAEEKSLFFLPSLRPSALLYPDLLAGCEGFNAEAQRFAESRREVFFSAFLRVPLRLCVKTGLASRLRLGRAANLCVSALRLF